MRKHAGGLICLALSEDKVQNLGLKMMTPDNRSPRETAFTVSIEARVGVSTGISAADRAHTVRVAARKGAVAEEVCSPGHIFPLRARKGGVLVRSGHTEGSVDLASLAGLEPAAVICEIMNDDGTMARMPELEIFAKAHGLHILSIADLIEWRLQRESLVEKTFDGKITTGLLGHELECQGLAYRSSVERTEYLALVVGEVAGPEPVLVRVQTACLPGDVFASRACDCGAQLARALELIEAEGRGVLLYVYPAGRASMLADIDAHVAYRPAGASGPGSAEKLREFGLGAQVLAGLGVEKIRLLTNNPKKIVGITGYGIDVVERVPIETAPTRQNVTFLSQRARAGELIGDVKRELK
jgi:3,4-dihydroxy 2-butanone 4-phosphate synthase/GTP cyclohydrolase II